MSRSILAALLALAACAPDDDGRTGRKQLVGSYVLIVPAEHPRRKDLVGSSLRLSRDGMFTQQCRYKSGKSDSAIGTWSYANHRAQFSVFKDCAGVLGKRDSSASLAVEFAAPTKIVVASHSRVRYERRGPP